MKIFLILSILILLQYSEKKIYILMLHLLIPYYGRFCKQKNEKIILKDSQNVRRHSTNKKSLFSWSFFGCLQESVSGDALCTLLHGILHLVGVLGFASKVHFSAIPQTKNSSGFRSDSLQARKIPGGWRMEMTRFRRYSLTILRHPA